MTVRDLKAQTKATSVLILRDKDLEELPRKHLKLLGEHLTTMMKLLSENGLEVIIANSLIPM